MYHSSSIVEVPTMPTTPPDILTGSAEYVPPVIPLDDLTQVMNSTTNGDSSSSDSDDSDLQHLRESLG